jgi:hypothetical protein
MAEQIQNPFNKKDEQAKLSKQLEHLTKLIGLLPQNNMNMLWEEVDNMFHDKEIASNIKVIVEKLEGMFKLNGRDKKSKGSLNDAQLKEYLMMGQKPEVDKILEEFNTPEVGSMLGPGVARQLDSTLKSFLEVNLKYRFYLYKYLQMNAYIPALTNAVHEMNMRMYQNMVALTTFLHEKHTSIVSNYMNAFQRALEFGNFKELEALEKDLAGINIKVTTNMQEVFKDVLERSKNIETQSSQELLEWLMSQNEELRGQVLKGIQKKP